MNLLFLFCVLALIDLGVFRELVTISRSLYMFLMFMRKENIFPHVLILWERTSLFTVIQVLVYMSKAYSYLRIYTTDRLM